MIDRFRGWLSRHNMELLGPSFPRLHLAYRRGDRVSVKTLLWFGFFWFLAGTFLMDAQVGIAINWLHKPLEFFTISPKHTVLAIVATVFCAAFPLLVRPFWEKREE